MIPFKEIECNDTAIISNKIYRFLNESTDLISSGVTGWQFLDHKHLFKAVPELVKFFAQQKLIPNSASVVILNKTGQLPLHVDELPVVAKINFPVINTRGWINRWYSVPNELLESCPKTTNQFGKSVEMLEAIPQEHFKLIAEIKDLTTPIVFNSRIPHEVIKDYGYSPRIIASFTFFNEPLHLLQ